MAAILDLFTVDYLTNPWVGVQCDFVGGDWKKVPVDDQRLRSFKMATMAAILDLVSVDYVTNASVDWSDVFVAYWG
jgi:hypothetical protein